MVVEGGGYGWGRGGGDGMMEGSKGVRGDAFFFSLLKQKRKKTREQKKKIN